MTIHSSRARNASLTYGLILISSLVAQQVFGAYASVDVYNGPEDDVAAIGRFLSRPDGEHLGAWTLQSSVEGTDFSNAHVGGGSEGLQYTMLNPVFGSADTNSIVFSVAPVNGMIPQLSIKQSPEFNDPKQWNGGNLPTDISEFTMSWSGGGEAVVTDPAGQFQIAQMLSEGSDSISVSPGSTLTFSDFQIFNSDDEWSVVFPEGTSSVQIDWGSSNPTPGSDLTREWVAFDANFVSAVPEPEGMELLLLFAPLLLLRTRRESMTL